MGFMRRPKTSAPCFEFVCGFAPLFRAHRYTHDQEVPKSSPSITTDRLAGVDSDLRVFSDCPRRHPSSKLVFSDLPRSHDYGKLCGREAAASEVPYFGVYRAQALYCKESGSVRQRAGEWQ